MNKAETLFESYNNALEEAYEKYFEENKTEEILNPLIDELSNKLRDRIKIWNDAPLQELDGLSPRQYFAGISDFDDIIGHFKLGAKLCDDVLPEVLIDKLLLSGDRSFDTLVEFSSDKQLIGSEEEFYLPKAAIRLLANWKSDQTVEYLIRILLSCEKENEIIMEEISDALVNIGNLVADRLIAVLEEASEVDFRLEYLYSALTQIGREVKADRIYRCLKNVFLKMEDKILGAMCMADYGDGRAIPLLRGYAAKNAGKINKELYLEIKAAIVKLGGNAEDLNTEL